MLRRREFCRLESAATAALLKRGERPSGMLRLGNVIDHGNALAILKVNTTMIALSSHACDLRFGGCGRRGTDPVWILSVPHEAGRVAFLPPTMMSTRSFIARKTDDGFEGVYCHWDGYVEHNGSILLQHYTDPDKVAVLLSHGDMSLLSEAVGEKHGFEDREKPWTTYYGRDRGETRDSVKTKRSQRLRPLMKYAEGVGCEYFYLFDRGRWQYAARGPQYFGMSDGSPFSKLRPLKVR